MKRYPKLLSSILQLSSMKHQSFSPTTQHKTMLEDEISLLSSFPLKESKKEEAEGAYVVVRF